MAKERNQWLTRQRINTLKARTRRSLVKTIMVLRPIPIIGRSTNKLMQITFDSMADNWDLIRSDESFLLGFQSALAELPKSFTPNTVADLACGTGLAAKETLKSYPDANIAGFDISPKMIEEATKRVQGVNFVVSSSEALPLEAGSIDLVTSVDGVFSIDEIARVTAKGGYVLIVYSKQGTTPVSLNLDNLAERFEALNFTCKIDREHTSHFLIAQLK